jgi:hypothetical protein
MRPAADEQSSGPLNFGLGIADLIPFTLRSPYIQIRRPRSAHDIRRSSYD